MSDSLIRKVKITHIPRFRSTYQHENIVVDRKTERIRRILDVLNTKACGERRPRCMYVTLGSTRQKAHAPQSCVGGSCPTRANSHQVNRTYSDVQVWKQYRSHATIGGVVRAVFFHDVLLEIAVNSSDGCSNALASNK